MGVPIGRVNVWCASQCGGGGLCESKTIFYDFAVADHFPGARRFLIWEGGAAFKAERGSKAYVIVDQGTMADLLDEKDPAQRKALEALVSVMEFDSESERDAYADSMERRHYRESGSG